MPSAPARAPLAPKDLPQDVAACHALIREYCAIIQTLVEQLEAYKHRVDYLERKLFGRSSERVEGELPPWLDAHGARDETAAPAPAPAAEPACEPETTTTAANRSGRHGRKPLPKDLPRVTIVHDLKPEEKICPACNGDLPRIGEERSEQIEYKPSSLHIVEHVRYKYGPCSCGLENCASGIILADKPAQPIEKGLAGPGLLAHVITSKYADHLPLNRQEDIFERHGVEIPRSTQCDWVMQAAEAIAPVVEAMKKEMIKTDLIQTDDTPVKVQDPGKPGRTHQSHLWVYCGGEAAPHIVYDFTWTRERAGPEKFLEGYKGWLQADAFSGYDNLFSGGAIVEVACWAHARRYFFEAKESDPVRAAQAMERIRELYAIEDEAKEKIPISGADRENGNFANGETHRRRSPEEVRALRQEKALPKVNAIFDWLRSIQLDVLPKSPMGKAIMYALNQEIALRRYLEDGRLSIDNNNAERALRRVVVGRSNWLFIGSRRGGRAAAICYSLVASARRHGLDPFAYLRDLLTRLPTHPQSRIQEFFPNNWKTAHAPVA